jgi:hypothetical protein
MYSDDDDREKFEDTLRSIAEEVGRSVERLMMNLDVDEIADSFGVDATRAREWADTAGSWLRSQAEHLGDEVAARAGQPQRPEQPQPETAADDPLRSAAPHPLDLPTDDQGLALAALDSGRWVIEPGTGALAAHGEGPGPSDALGLVRELRARDWIAADGKITVTGRHALDRWLEAASAS